MALAVPVTSDWVSGRRWAVSMGFPVAILLLLGFSCVRFNASRIASCLRVERISYKISALSARPEGNAHLHSPRSPEILQTCFLCSSQNGDAVLHVAAMLGWADVVSALLANGADPNVRNEVSALGRSDAGAHSSGWADAFSTRRLAASCAPHPHPKAISVPFCCLLRPEGLPSTRRRPSPRTSTSQSSWSERAPT